MPTNENRPQLSEAELLAKGQGYADQAKKRIKETESTVQNVALTLNTLVSDHTVTDDNGNKSIGPLSDDAKTAAEDEVKDFVYNHVGISRDYTSTTPEGEIIARQDRERHEKSLGVNTATAYINSLSLANNTAFTGELKGTLEKLGGEGVIFTIAEDPDGRAAVDLYTERTKPLLEQGLDARIVESQQRDLERAYGPSPASSTA